MLESTFGMTKYTSNFSFPCQYCLASCFFYQHTTEVASFPGSAQLSVASSMEMQGEPGSEVTNSFQYHFNALIWHRLVYRGSDPIIYI